MTILYQITARHFVAGIVVNDEHKVAEGAPIVNYMVTWPIGRVISYCRSKGWKIVKVTNDK